MSVAALNGCAGTEFDLAEYREELKVGAGEIIGAGLPLTVCEGKNSGGAMGDGWQRQRLSLEDAERLIDEPEHPTIGIMQRSDGTADFDIDGENELKAFMELFDNDPPHMPQYTSGREGGEHRLAKSDPRLKSIDQATVKYECKIDGKKHSITVRIGCKRDEETGEFTGSHSVVPPSRHAIKAPGSDKWEWTGKRYQWKEGCDLDTLGLPSLPESVVQKLLAAAEKKKSGTAENSAAGSCDTALQAMLTATKNMEDKNDGSMRLVTVACRAVEFNLPDQQAIDTIRAYATDKPFHTCWSDEDILKRVRYAETKVVRGSAVVIANCTTVEIDEDGGKKTVTIPLSMSDIIDTINKRMGDWPRRVDNILFVDDPRFGLDYFDRRTTAALFGWLRRHCKVKWTKGGSFVSQAELFAEIERTTRRYEAIELLPHEPPIENIYYRGKAPNPSGGAHLRKLLDRFRPETTIDRDLIQAALMTSFWGGLPGCRPAFVVTSDDGRGVGKSKVAEVIGYLCGGHIDVSAGEDIGQLKTRMLTPAARTKRIALLDNVKTLRFSWAELEAMITGPIISGRQLYVGEGQRPNLLTWFITLNGVSMATDMAQRSVIIKVVKGRNDGLWWEQTRQFIDHHREAVIGDIIGALRADPFPVAEFSRWATWEQHVLCRLPEPAETQRVIIERQGVANCELDEAEIIEGHFAEQLSRLGYDPNTAQVRIPVAVAARWFGWAVGQPTKTMAASRRLNQMASEGQTRRISPDPSRTYGRCFIWTGPAADVVGQPIANDLGQRIANFQDSKDA